MAHGVFTSENLTEILRQIDEEVVLELGTSRNYEMVVVGGCALLLADLCPRTFTRDIDALRYDAAIQGIVGRHLEVNTQVGVYVDRLPKGFEGRLVPLPVEAKAVTFLRPSNEDLAVMKLYSWRGQDQDDLLNENMLASLNPVLLGWLIYGEDEAKASSNTKLMYERMVETYEKEFLPRVRKIARRERIGQWLEGLR